MSDSAFTSQLPFGADAGSVGSQAYNVLISPVTAKGNAVDYKLGPIGQIDENCGIGTLYNQDLSLLNEQTYWLNFQNSSQLSSSASQASPANKADEKGRSAEERAERPTEQDGGDE